MGFMLAVGGREGREPEVPLSAETTFFTVDLACFRCLVINNNNAASAFAYNSFAAPVIAVDL